MFAWFTSFHLLGNCTGSPLTVKFVSLWVTNSPSAYRLCSWYTLRQHRLNIRTGLHSWDEKAKHLSISWTMFWLRMTILRVVHILHRSGDYDSTVYLTMDSRRCRVMQPGQNCSGHFIWHITVVTCSSFAVGHFHSNITEDKQVVIGCRCQSRRITYWD